MQAGLCVSYGCILVNLALDDCASKSIHGPVGPPDTVRLQQRAGAVCSWRATAYSHAHLQSLNW